VVMALEKNAMVPYTPARARICLDPIPRDLYKMAVVVGVSHLQQSQLSEALLSVCLL
jgi:hypothetical protein